MRLTVFHSALGASLALLACGCSGSSDDQAYCPGINAPVVLTLSNVLPAAGSSVENDAIVHSFSIDDDLAFQDIAISYTDAHTAGDPKPALAFTYTIGDTTTDFAAAAVVWSSAPGHVEFDDPLVYQTTDGCAFILPSPLFSYDITAPGTATSGD